MQEKAMKRKTSRIEGLYSAGEAQRIIGCSPSQFYSLVKKGVLDRVQYPGREEFYYPKNGKKGVDAYVRALNAFSDAFSTTVDYDFGLALPKDLEEIYDLNSKVSGGPSHAIPVDIMSAWMRMNPQSLFVLRRNDIIVGYASMFPLSKKGIIGRANKTYLNRNLPLEEIGQYIPGMHIDMYVAELAVTNDASFTKTEKKMLGARLLSELISFLIKLLEQDIVIDGLYAVGTSDYGIMLCKKLGLKELNYPEGISKERIPYGIIIEEIEDKYLLLSEYKKHLKEKS